jgi:hypothetical protein
MNDAAAFAEKYLAVWNEPDALKRRAGVEDLWVLAGGHYSYSFARRGYDELDDRVSGAYEQWVNERGFLFRPMDDATGRDGVVKFHWEMVPAAGGDAVSVGFDFVILAEDGRIEVDYQFVEPPQPSADRNEFVDRYLAVWHETDDEKRKLAVAELWAPDAVLSHDHGVATGHAEIVDLIGQSSREIVAKGLVARRFGDADGHHEVLRWSWQLAPADGDGAPVTSGFEFLVRDEQGQIQRDYQFDEPPQA